MPEALWTYKAQVPASHRHSFFDELSSAYGLLQLTVAQYEAVLETEVGRGFQFELDKTFLARFNLVRLREL
jgi:hypothetical protein